MGEVLRSMAQMSPLKQQSFHAASPSTNAPAMSDDPQAFLLANCRSLGQLGNPGNSGADAMDFDMEWAYYSLMDEESKSPRANSLVRKEGIQIRRPAERSASLATRMRLVMRMRRGLRVRPLGGNTGRRLLRGRNTLE